jgi:Membrane-fusion protein
VKLGPADGERVSITSGLVPGDRVVVDGTDRLRDGAKINIAGKTKPTAGTDATSKKAAANP